MELLHAPTSAWSGATGVQSMQSDFSATGDEAFLPASKTRSHALFAFEELVHGALAWQFGARLERSTVSTEDRRRRRELPWSAAAGVVWKIDPVHAVAVSLTQTARAPNAQELFADGPHAGTQAFEIGNASLRKERSVGLEASLRRRTGFVTGALTAYTNDFDGYIFEQPTGEYFAETATGWQPQSSPELGEEALPVYRYVQRDARFWGAELETIWHLHAGKDRQLDLRFAADFTRARGGGQWLPRIPAPRLTAGFFWAHAGWSAGAESQWTLKQNRVAPNETPSPGYALVDAHITRTWTAAGLQWETFVRATNLTDAEARPHTSFVKEQVPLAGRAVTAGVRLTF